jgi:hypothetical protein
MYLFYISKTLIIHKELWGYKTEEKYTSGGTRTKKKVERQSCSGLFCDADSKQARDGATTGFPANTNICPLVSFQHCSWNTAEQNKNPDFRL